MRFVLVFVLVLAANRAGGKVVYVAPDGWSLEVSKCISYTEQMQWREYEGTYNRVAAMRGLPQGYVLQREMSKHPADYFWCFLRVDCPGDISFGPEHGFVAVLKDSTRVPTVRMLFVDGPPEFQKRLYDTSRERVLLCARGEDGKTLVGWAKEDGEWAVPVCLHFPYDTVGAVDEIKRLFYTKGGERACADTDSLSSSSSSSYSQPLSSP